MKARTKEIIRDGFGSLVSNASALRGAKAGPLWLTIVMFFLAVLLPIIPLFVSQANTNGSTFLNNYSYNLDKNVTLMAMELKNNRNVEFEIDSDHLLTVRENDQVVDYSMYGYVNPFAGRVNERTNQFELLLFISDATTDANKATVVDLISKKVYGYNTTHEVAAEDGLYHPSYIVLFKNGIYVSVYSDNSLTQLTASYNGDFKTINPNNKCLETLLKVDGVAQDPYNSKYVIGVYANFKKLLDKSYDTLKIRNMWVTSAIYFGIFFGASFLMGLIMFLLTRGKNNPNNYFSLWLCLKIQGRLSFCPGLLAMIAGWFLTSQIPLIFIMLIGLRVMWISMKELRPIQA